MALLVLTAPAAIKEVRQGSITLPFFHEPTPVRVLFVGDIMLDRSVAAHAEAAGDEALFAGAAPLVAGRDFVVGNLEGTITNNPSVSRVDPGILRFTFAPRMAEVLARAGFSAVSLANNHALDFGEFGYEDTFNYLAKQEIVAFGSPFNEQHIAAEIRVRDKTLCLVGYHQLFDPSPDNVLAKIKDIKPRCSYTVLVAHWGEEYQHEPTPAQRSAAHTFIDAGVDVVIGAHPHVVEPLEIYKGKAIFYSLGNFIFDQGWMPEVRRGLAVGIEFSDATTRFMLAGVDTFKEASAAGATTTKAVLADLIAPGLPADISESILTAAQFELKN